MLKKAAKQIDKLNLLKDLFPLQVHLSFLFVGHTHEDVDACFSHISKKLRMNDAETIPDLKKTITRP